MSLWCWSSLNTLLRALWIAVRKPFSWHYLFSLCVTVYTTTLFSSLFALKVQNPPLEHSSFLSVPPKKPSTMGFDEVHTHTHTHAQCSVAEACVWGSFCAHPGVHDQSGPESWPSWADAEDAVRAGAQLSGCRRRRWQVRFSCSSSPPLAVSLIRAPSACAVDWCREAGLRETISIRAVAEIRPVETSWKWRFDLQIHCLVIRIKRKRVINAMC